MEKLIELSPELCRICLEVGAEYPIFEKSALSEESIEHKISQCLCEKIEDTEGLPRYICSKCSSTVDLIYEFVNKIKESNRALHPGFTNIKLEQETYSDNETYYIFDDDYSEEPEKLPTINKKADIKVETDETKNESLDESIQSLFSQELKIKKIKIEPAEAKKKTHRPKTKAKNKTNSVASSILEGTFEWTGRKWCTISGTTIKKLKKKNIKKEEPREKNKREPRIKIPKVKIKPENTFKLCDICGKTLKQSDTLKSHRKTHEASVKATCSVCNRQFKTSELLRAHMISVHRERKYVCDICGAAFTLRHRLAHHTRTVHEKHLHPQKLYQCSFCSKSYKTKQSVEIHERSVHTGLRPAVCTVCDASFFHEEYLKQHMRLHTGETPFKCPVCGRGYAQRGNMKSHIHHNHRLSQLTTEQLASIKPVYLKVMKP